jgi:hypothetical protein
MLEKIKKKWGITSFFQVVIIFIVFGVTGSASTLFSGPVLEFLNIGKGDFHPIIYWPMRLLILFPIYQVLLIWFGFVFGVTVSVLTFQKDKFIFNFFYKMAINMSKGMLRLMSFGYLFKK